MFDRCYGCGVSGVVTSSHYSPADPRLAKLVHLHESVERVVDDEFVYRKWCGRCFGLMYATSLNPGPGRVWYDIYQGAGLSLPEFLEFWNK